MQGCEANLDAVHVICDMVGLKGTGSQGTGQGKVEILQMQLVWSAALHTDKFTRPRPDIYTNYSGAKKMQRF